MNADSVVTIQEPGARPVMRRTPLVIRPTSGWGHLGLVEVWHFRELLWYLTMRDLKSRYRQTALGPLWFVIRPLVTMVVFTFVFGGLAKLPSGGVPYPIFTYAALIPWTLFSSALTDAVGSLTSNMNMISKVYFPRLLVPLSALLSALIDMAASSVILLIMMLYYGYLPSWKFVILPFYVLLALATALGLGLWGASQAVRFRDIKLGVGFALQVWLFLTPVAYSAAIIPARWLPIYELNPMFWVVEGFRWALVGAGQGPAWFMLIPVVAVICILFTGAYVFRRAERTVVDLL